MRTTLTASLVVLSLVAVPAVSSAQMKPKNQMLPNGTVKSVSASSLVVTAKDSDQTFTVDAKTHVVGKGIGTKSRAAAGKPTIVDLLKAGDRVTVTYQDNAGTLHASKIEVTMAAPTK
jgi:hypothetical protein